MYKSIAQRMAIVAAAYAILLPGLSCASVVLSGTRTIYPSSEGEVTVQVSNNDKKYPRLVQAWIDDGRAELAPEKLDVPFQLTPSVFRIEPEATQALRIVYSKEPLPGNKESLFWLNVLEVPPKVTESGQNSLQFAFRIRTKLFFRPSGLPGDANQAPAKLRYTVTSQDGKPALRIQNPTPYYVSFDSLHVGESKLVPKDTNSGLMLAPGETTTVVMSAPIDPAGKTKVEYSTINDFGAFSPFTAALNTE